MIILQTWYKWCLSAHAQIAIHSVWTWTLTAGADLQNLVNQAALEAARKGKESVETRDLEYAKDKIVMGKH